MKVDLYPSKPYRDPGCRALQITHESKISKSPPFFQTTRGCYVHRPRSATIYYDKGIKTERVFSHIGVTFWCGGVGFISPKRNNIGWLDEVPASEVICATCEGRAIGAGLLGSVKINGHAVKFSPRTPKA